MKNVICHCFTRACICTGTKVQSSPSYTTQSICMCTHVTLTRTGEQASVVGEGQGEHVVVEAVHRAQADEVLFVPLCRVYMAECGFQVRKWTHACMSSGCVGKGRFP